MKKAILFSLILFLVISCNKDDNEGGGSSGANLITTKAITNITGNSAISGGNITIGGNATISTRGVCWGTQDNPTIANFTTNNGNGGGEFDSNITNLNPNTTYYVRAYATDSNGGTSYGNEVQFTTIKADKVYTGDITLRTQAEVENFGSMGYTGVTGKLCIGCGGPNDIFDLGPLSTLKDVKTLSIENNIVLIKLNGLENLTELDNLWIKQNPLIENLDSFIGVTAINTVELDDNTSLTDIDGLNNLTAIRENIKMNNTRAIALNLENVTFLGGLECLNSRFETITISSGAPKVGGLTIQDCQSLTELNVSNIEEMDHFILERNNNLNNLNFENLVKVNGTFFIKENVGLSSLNIPSIEETGDFKIWTNNNLNNLNLESLVKVDGSFSMADNESLSSINVDNLKSLQTVHFERTYFTTINLESLQTPVQPISIEIIYNWNLININLNNVTKALSVKYNGNKVLPNIQLDALTTVENDLQIRHNENLNSVALNNLTELNGYSKILQNFILETFEANNLTKAEDLDIDDNLQLTSLRLPNLSSLKSLILKKSKVSDLSLGGLQNRAEPTSLFIRENPFLTSLYFGSMTTANLVRIEKNDNLLTINFQNLTEISGDIRIAFNSRLQSFEANSLTQVGELYIVNPRETLSNISMQNLSEIDRSFTLVRSAVTNLDSFSSLIRIGDNLNISDNHSLTDFCGLTNLMTNGYIGNYNPYQNGYNPSQQDIIDGNCSL